jgi:hypothetical protein
LVTGETAAVNEAENLLRWFAEAEGGNHRLQFSVCGNEQVHKYGNPKANQFGAPLSEPA